MSTFTIVKKFNLEKPVSEDFFINLLEDALKRDFKDIKIGRNKKNEQILSCTVKTKLGDSVVSVKGVLDLNIKDNSLKIMIDADLKRNGSFWFDIFLGLLPIFYGWGWIFLFFQYQSNKKISIESMNNVMDRVQFQLEGA